MCNLQRNINVCVCVCVCERERERERERLIWIPSHVYVPCPLSHLFPTIPSPTYALQFLSGPHVYGPVLTTDKKTSDCTCRRQLDKCERDSVYERLCCKASLEWEKSFNTSHTPTSPGVIVTTEVFCDAGTNFRFYSLPLHFLIVSNLPQVHTAMWRDVDCLTKNSWMLATFLRLLRGKWQQWTMPELVCGSRREQTNFVIV
jgi:hypothetical protein